MGSARRMSSQPAPPPPPPPPPPPSSDASAPHLPAVVEIIEESDLRDVVDAADARGIPLIFDFYADWCGPCKTLTPKLEALVASQPRGTLTLVKLNVDAHPSVSDHLKITSLPTVMTMHRGKFVDTFQARSLHAHWFPYDRVGGVNADP